MTKRRLLPGLLGAAVLALGTAACVWAPVKPGADLGQGWSQTDRDLWYEQSQGSRLLPLSWAKVLEGPGGTPFFSPANMARYRYLPAEATSLSGLPVGFAIDRQPGAGLTYSAMTWMREQPKNAEWLGMNCSACHTAELTAGAARTRVDGGPAVSDFQTLIEELDASLRATRDDPAKFARFAAAVLGKANDDDNRRRLTGALTILIDWQARTEALNSTDIRYGYARLDAFGHIFNKVRLFADDQDGTPNPANAPVSYPFLWNTSQSDRVQWNGIVSNKAIALRKGGPAFDYGALGRNAGEVTGVFGDVRTTPKAGLGGYRSSVRVQLLSELERLLGRLRPPVWPADFPKPDPALVKLGEKTFDEERCADCHVRFADRNDITTPFKATISLFRPGVAGNTPPGTDPWMACNAYLYDMGTGRLEGTKASLVTGPVLRAREKVSTVLETTVKGTLAGQKRALVEAAAKAIYNANLSPRPRPPEVGFVDPEVQRALDLKTCLTAESPILGYKGRPLAGVWATAPFLHNGSVPSLYALLLPPAQRPKSFYLGTRAFDARDVGYLQAKAADNSFEFRVLDQAGKPIPGNGNGGHDYNNAGLSPLKRRALVEYLKAL